MKKIKIFELGPKFILHDLCIIDQTYSFTIFNTKTTKQANYSIKTNYPNYANNVIIFATVGLLYFIDFLQVLGYLI